MLQGRPSRLAPLSNQINHDLQDSLQTSEKYKDGFTVEQRRGSFNPATLQVQTDQQHLCANVQYLCAYAPHLHPSLAYLFGSRDQEPEVTERMDMLGHNPSTRLKLRQVV